jgi:hypothetical protein
MKIKQLATLFIGVLLITMVSCEYVTVESFPVIIPDKPISYATQVAPIFVTAGCTGCHSGGEAPDFRADKSFAALTSGNYINTADPAKSSLVLKITSGHQTSGNISANSKALLLKWIEEGAKNN